MKGMDRYYPIIKIDGYKLKETDQILDYISKALFNRVLAVLPRNWHSLAEVSINKERLRVHYKARTTQGDKHYYFHASKQF